MLLSTRLTGTIDNLHCHLMPYDLASEIDSSRIHPSNYTFNCRFCRIAMLCKAYKLLDHRHLFQRHPTQLKLHPTPSNSIQYEFPQHTIQDAILSLCRCCLYSRHLHRRPDGDQGRPLPPPCIRRQRFNPLYSQPYLHLTHRSGFATSNNRHRPLLRSHIG